MKTKLLAAAAALAIGLAGASAANAVILVDNGGLTWTTQLNWNQTGQITSVGSVQAKEVDANNVQVTVTLINPALFADNGNGHIMFGFNLLDTPESNVTFVSANFPSADVAYSTSAVGDNNPPTGSDFANSPFGHFDNSWQFTDVAPQTLPGNTPSFVFNVANSGGITFAGLGATYDSVTGQLLTQGTGNHFFSNGDGSVPGPNNTTVTGGWWFSADTSGTGTCGTEPRDITCAVAGRDAFAPVTGGVPEPATWALMVMGFGGLGAVLRRKRVALAAA